MVLEVAMREMRTRARTKSFRIITGLLIVVAILGPLAISLWPEGDTEAEQVRVGLIGEVDPVLARQIRVLGGAQFRFELVDFGDLSQADIDSSLSSDDVDVVVALPDEIVWDESVDESIAPLLREFLQRNAILTRAEGAGISTDEVAELLAPLAIEQRFVDAADNENELRALGVVGLMTAFLLPQVFGQLTMMSVVEEKSTGVVEVILSHIRPRTLLWGKVSALSLETPSGNRAAMSGPCWACCGVRGGCGWCRAALNQDGGLVRADDTWFRLRRV